MSTLFEALQLDIVLFAIMEMLPAPIHAGQLPHIEEPAVRGLPKHSWRPSTRRSRSAAHRRIQKVK